MRCLQKGLVADTVVTWEEGDSVMTSVMTSESLNPELRDLRILQSGTFFFKYWNNCGVSEFLTELELQMTHLISSK